MGRISLSQPPLSANLFDTSDEMRANKDSRKSTQELLEGVCWDLYSAPDREIEVAIAIVIDKSSGSHDRLQCQLELQRADQSAIAKPEICDPDRMAIGYQQKQLCLHEVSRSKFLR